MNYESKTVVKCFPLNIDVAFVHTFILVKKNVKTVKRRQGIYFQENKAILLSSCPYNSNEFNNRSRLTKRSHIKYGA